MLLLYTYSIITVVHNQAYTKIILNGILKSMIVRPASAPRCTRMTWYQVIATAAPVLLATSAAGLQAQLAVLEIFCHVDRATVPALCTHG